MLCHLSYAAEIVPAFHRLAGSNREPPIAAVLAGIVTGMSMGRKGPARLIGD